MENKNPLIRLLIYGKLKRMMTSYVGETLGKKDINLVRGVFRKKLKDFDDEYRDNVENRTLFSRVKGELRNSTKIEGGA